MGKRSDFERKPRDYYVTPLEPVKPLIPFLPKDEFSFCEPCAGNGALIEHIEKLSNGWCCSAYDIEPQVGDIVELDALDLTEEHLNSADLIVTNPPWVRDKKSGYLLHKLIERFANLRPTYLLFDSDWAYTEQSSELMSKYCTDIIAIGRIKWFGDTSGKDNASWYRFDKNKSEDTRFHGR